MSLKKISKDQPEKFEFNDKNIELAKKMINNFNEEVKNFIQVCPKEMLNKLKNPISFKSKIKQVS